MFKNFIRILSLLLIVSMLWNMLPVSVLGADLREALNADDDAVLIEPDFTLEEKEPEEITILGELTERRTENIKEYLLSNGNTLAAVYESPVHYQENGQWKEIDNTLIAKNGTYVNTAGLLSVSFPQSLTGNNYITISKDGYTLSFGMAGQLRDNNELVAYSAVSRTLTQPEAEISVSAAKTALAQLQAVDLTQAKEAAKYPELVQEKLTSRLSYSNVYDNTNITYDLDSNRVKESVILSQYDATLRGYRYTLQTGSMIPVLGTDGHIDFYDAEQEEIVMTMPAPFLVDANTEYNWDVDVTLTGSNGVYTLTYSLPKQWLAAEDRAWPTVLDPVVEVNNNYQYVADQTVFSRTTKPYTWGILQCGYGTEQGISRFYLKFSQLPTLTSADVVVDAQVTLRKAVDSTYPFYVSVHKVNGSWSSSGITWSNKPSFDANATDFIMVKDAGAYSWDVTDLARQWYQTGTNYGMVFRASDSVENNSTANHWSQFYSADYGAYEPEMTIEYRNTSGVEDYWDYTSASAGQAGAAYVNNSAGNLVFTRNLMAFDGNRMPVSIDLVYNASDKDISSYGIGRGWRTNYNQRIYPFGSDYYVWEDGDGTRHYFRYNATKGAYYDEDNLNLVITEDYTVDNIILTDLAGNTSTFEMTGRLIKLQNNQETPSSINITYVGDTNRISQITDGVGRKYVFTYTNNLLTRISYYATGTSELDYVSLSYTNGNLTEITDPDLDDSLYNLCTCTYTYTNNLLTTASDPHGVGLTFTYLGSAPNRLVKMAEHSGTTYGNHIEFSYGNKWTTLTDKQGNVQHMLFNAYGNTVSVQDDKGNAIFAKYATDQSESATKNQLVLSSDMQGTVVDLLTNGNFEGTTQYTASGVVDANFAQSSLLGSRGYYMMTTSGSLGTLSFGNFTIAPGESYTLSAYIKINLGEAYLRFLSGSTIYAQSVSLTEADQSQWKRLAVSYTNTSNNSITVTPQVCVDKAGYVYLDGVQLEKSASAGRLNLVENGDFTVASSNTANYGWTHSNLTSTDGRKTLTSAATIMDNNVMKITGSPTTQKRVSQRINIKGKAGEVFTIAGWGKGYVPESDSTYYGIRRFGIDLTFYSSGDTIVGGAYLFFSPHLDGWQYAAGQAVPASDYAYAVVELVCDYNINDVYFDGIQLYQGGFGTEYKYYINGDVASATNSKGQKTTFEYTNRDLEQITNYDGSLVYYEYDSHKNITKELINYDVENNGVTRNVTQTTLYTYDAYGNAIESEKTVITTNPGSPISQNTTTSSATYTANGNYLATSTDEKGNTTTYSYDTDKGVLESVQLPGGGEVCYSYDNLLRPVRITQKENTDIESNVRYSYSGDRVDGIDTGSTIYTFGYGAFGKAQQVRAGNRLLVSYEYDDSQNLSDLNYGNGGKVEYAYDSQGHVTEERYINCTEVKTVNYTYDTAGKLIRVNDGLSNRVTIYCYDSQNRLISAEIKENGTLLRAVRYDYNEYDQVIQKTETKGTEAPVVTTYEYNSLHLISELTKDNVYQHTSYNELGLPEQTVMGYTSTDETDHTVRQDTYVYGMAQSDYAEKELYQHQIIYGSKNETYTYAYDECGNIAQIIRNDGSAQTIIKYSYNKANQLIREDNQLADRTWEMTYDEAGNMLSRKAYYYTTAQTPTGEITDERKVFTYGDGGWDDLLATINGAGVSTDAIGNIISDGGNNYTWKNGKQLVSLNQYSFISTFEYDASGLRTKRTSGNTTYTYTYDGNTLTGMTAGNKNLSFFYDSSGKPAAVKYNVAYYYYVTNALGDVVAIVNHNGVAMVTYTYDAWGNVLSIGGLMASTLGIYNPFLYRGYVYDYETGHYYIQSRYYNPKIGRFISADSISSLGVGGTAQSYNLFVYCGNSPVLFKYNSYSGTISGNGTPIQGADINRSINITSNPLVFSIGLLTQKSKNIPSWMSINAFYVEATLLQDLSLISLATGVLDATFHTPKWFSSLPGDHLANPNVYFGVGTWNANASIGIGASGSAEILSGTVGVRFGDVFSVGIKGYVGVGIAIDFSKGIKLGLGLGLGVEASIEIDWYLLFN